MFKLHPVIERDTVTLGKFSLCQLLLMNDANYPWFLLVPEVENIQEIYQLSEADQVQLLKESCYFSRQLTEIFNPDKLNIAALGNIVPQLHLHHIVRYVNDLAWPTPVWGKLKMQPYSDTQIATLVKKLKPGLTKHIEWGDINTG